MYPWKISTSGRTRGKEHSAKQRILFPSLPSSPLPSLFPLAFWIFCRSGHVSIIESLASAATDEFQLVAGWPVSRGPRMGFPGFCTSSFHGTTRSFAFRPYLLHLLLLFHLPLVHLSPPPPSLPPPSSPPSPRHRHRRKSLYPCLPLFSFDRTPNLESLLSGTGRLD